MSARDRDHFRADGTARVRFLERARAGRKQGAWRELGRREARVDARAASLEALAQNARAHDVPFEAVELALEVTRFEPDLDPSDTHALFHLALATLVAVRQGSTRLPLGDALVEVLRGWLDEEREAHAAAGSIGSLIERGGARGVLGRAGDFKPLIIDQGFVYLERLLRAEERFAAALAGRLLRGAFPLDGAGVRAAIADVVARPARSRGRPVALSDEQLRAIERAVLAPVTVISGGPGTGKTSIVVSILRVLVRLGLPPETFALAAPTGKAANRLAESIARTLEGVEDKSAHDQALAAHAPDPKTLHRLLGYSPERDRFAHHEHSPLSERTVIIDESSMIDLFLMDRLARAVRVDARLVLLGDAEQLPSVDAGTVLRDMTARGGGEATPLDALAVTLEKSFRMDASDPAGRNVLCVARAIQAGRVPLEASEAEDGERIVRRTTADGVRLRGGVELLEAAADPAKERERFLRRYFERRFSEHELHLEATQRTYALDGGSIAEADVPAVRRLFEHLESFKLLTVTRSRAQATGAEAVNALLHTFALEDAMSSGLDPRRMGEAGGYLPGEPVIAVRNDYERRLFNGDQGVILDVETHEGERRRMAVFAIDGRFAAFHVETALDLLDRAYALTVHKAQGSEFDEVVVLLPERDTPIFSREIVYTALTRARRSVVLIGDARELARGVGRSVRRWSGVSERLRRALLGELGTTDAGDSGR